MRFGYRSILYGGTLLTGLTGLVYQVVWQKYLSFIVGSEARSVSLVVAIFLTGLATGYRFWGRLTERSNDRRKLLRLYGFLEIGIGVYALAFPYFLHVIRWISYNGPNSILTDVAVTLLALFAPTFMMGATIPLLVAVVPETSDEIHRCHAKIYGINTLGACAGAFLATFVLIPDLGLRGSLLLGAAINLVVGAVFTANRLEDSLAEEEPIPTIPNRFGPGAIYLYTLVTGTVVLSLEVLVVRILNLTIGPGPHNFAIVVGVFILGLALGSLLLTERMMSVRYLFRALLFLLAYLVVVFYSIPYWAYWAHNARAVLKDLPVNYDVYGGGVIVFLIVILLPFLIPLGSMLPLVYSFLPKDSHDYGKKCGWLYFYNTVGTIIGAVVLSHLLLHAVDLDVVFKIDVALLAALAVVLLVREKRQAMATVVGIAAIAFFGLGEWDRGSHYLGLYRDPDIQPYTLQGLFRVPNLARDVTFFADGPDATVTILSRAAGPNPGSTKRVDLPEARALSINGKGDGDTVLDYSTIALAAVLPYLHAPDRDDLEAAVIGLGTGITGGVLAGAEDVRHVDVVEISSTLVEAAPLFDKFNGNLTEHPKVDLMALDGFKYFTRVDRPLDIVVSATSPPWVVGVENLFTPELYRLVYDALGDDGVLLQWFPLYTMDATLLKTVVHNVATVFPHLRLYVISSSEMGLLAAKQPVLDTPKVERMRGPHIRDVMKAMKIRDPAQLQLMEIYNTDELQFLARDEAVLRHTLDHPSMAYASDRLRFFDWTVPWDEFIDRRLVRMALYSDERASAFRGLADGWSGEVSCDAVPDGVDPVCLRTRDAILDWRAFVEAKSSGRPFQALENYDRLRQFGLVPPDPEFLADAAAPALDGRATPAQARPLIQQVILAHAKDGLWDAAESLLTRLRDAGAIDPSTHNALMANLRQGRQGFAAYRRSYQGG